MSSEAKLTIREKEICHLSLEGVMCRELEEQASDDYISVLKMGTDTNINLSTSGSYIHGVRVDDLESILHELKHFGFKVAILWAEGSWPEDTDFDNEVLKSVEEWDKEDWGCAGHILDRPGRQNPIFHHQCVIINLRQFTRIIQCRMHEYEASSEHFHDDYTPKWIKPVGEDFISGSQWSSYEESKKPYNLFNSILRSTLDVGLKVFNLDYNLRGLKVCTYPEDDIAWTEGEIFKKYEHADCIYDIRESYPDKVPLLEFKVQDSSVVYILNTESVPHVPVNDIQVMVCPCSGLHQFKFMEKSLDVMELVIWADYSPYSVAWMEILVHEWDGKDFHSFFEANKHRLNFDGTLELGFGTWEKFMASFESQEQWLTAWSKIQNLEHQFVVANLVQESGKIVNLIPENKNVLLQCSNIFLYESNYFNKGLETTFRGLSYIRNVQNISNKVYFNGDLNGNYYNMNNLNRVKWI
jgi:hypothetical protein